MGFASVGLVNAQSESLPTQKQLNNVSLVQTCLSSTYANITRIILPDSTFNINTSPMLLDSWNHIFNDFTLFAYANSLFEDFQERLQELAIQIDTENTNRKWRFRNFNPRYFNSSVSN